MVPIKPGDKSFDDIAMQQIKDIAGHDNEHNVLTDALQGSFDSLNAAFEDKLARYICQQYACSNSTIDATVTWKGGDKGKQLSRLYQALMNKFTSKKKYFTISKSPFS